MTINVYLKLPYGMRGPCNAYVEKCDESVPIQCPYLQEDMDSNTTCINLKNCI